MVGQSRVPYECPRAASQPLCTRHEAVELNDFSSPLHLQTLTTSHTDWDSSGYRQIVPKRDGRDGLDQWIGPRYSVRRGALGESLREHPEHLQCRP